MARPIIADHWMYADIQKVDEVKRQVFGYASTERIDSQGETVLKSAVEAALPDYMLWKNVREMHQPSAVGTAIEANMGEKGLWFGAQVIDDRAWHKVINKVYKGFSIGGKVTARDPMNKKIITGIALTEISLVDRPSNPDARFELVKRDDSKLRMQPVQVWACGCPEHQHLTKLDASLCMQDHADSLAKATEADDLGKYNETHDDHGLFASSGAAPATAKGKEHAHAVAQHAQAYITQSGRAYDITNTSDQRSMAHQSADAHNAAARAHRVAQDAHEWHLKNADHLSRRAKEASDHANHLMKAEEAGELAKATPPRGVTTPQFIGHAKSATEAKAIADACDSDAEKCDTLAVRHETLAKESQTANNPHAMMLHHRIAQGHRSLAMHKRQQSKDYTELAAKHDASVAKVDAEEHTMTLLKAIQTKRLALAEVL